MKQLIILVIIFVIGLAIGSSKSFKAGQEKANANLPEASQSASITCKDNGIEIEKVRALRDVDNKGFVVAANSMAACGKIITAIGKGDTNTMDAQTAFIIDAKKDIDKMVLDRTKLLKEMGIPNE